MKKYSSNPLLANRTLCSAKYQRNSTSLRECHFFHIGYTHSVHRTFSKQDEPHTPAFFFCELLTITHVSDIKRVIYEIKKLQPLIKRLDRKKIWLGPLAKPLDRTPGWACLLGVASQAERFTGEAAFSLIKGKDAAATAASRALPVEPLVH